jgi:PAS domain S-box-containing protein
MAGSDHTLPDRHKAHSPRLLPHSGARESVPGELIPFDPISVNGPAGPVPWMQFGPLFDQMPTAVIVAEAPSGRILAYNRRAADLWAGRLPHVDEIRDYTRRYPAFRVDGSRYGTEDFPMTRAIRYGECVSEEEMEFRLADGETRVLLVSAAPVRDGDGTIRYGIATLTDATQRRLDERRREFFSRLATTFRELREPAEVIRVAATALGEQLGVSSAAIAELDESGAGLRVFAEYRNGILCVADPPAELDFGAGVAGELRSGRIVAVEDVARHALLDDEAVEAFTAFEARSVLAVPMVGAEQVAARVVLVTHVAPRRWTRDEVELVARLAERSWAAWEEVRRASTLRQSEEWLRLALRAGAAAAWEWDLATDRLTWSQEHHEVLGTAPGTEIATTESFLARVHPDDRVRAARGIARIARVDLPREVGMEFRIVRQSGATRWIRVQGRVLLDVGGRPSRAYGVVLDVTERKRAELEREALLRQLRQANEAKSNFISVMSHEFRTPLTSVIGYAELLESGATGDVTPRQLQQLGRIKASAWHLTQVIDEVLTFSRMEAGREEVRLSSVDVSALVTDAVAIIEPAAKNKMLDVHIEVPAGLVVETDEGKLRQALVNLLGNAVKFTDRGHIGLHVREADGSLRLEVSDTGIGIPAEHLERIFDRFWQVNQDSTRTHGGTGLGLTVTRRIAELLGGTVGVRSTPGVGSTFIIDLPL